MTDQPGSPPGPPAAGSGRGDRAPEQRLPARRAPSEPGQVARADRFTASPQTHATAGLTPERAARIVRQSGNARWIAFLGTSVVALFVIIYYFYELGTPFSQARLDAQATVQQVTSIERGYNLFQANCARCHGPNGEGTNGGYIGPPLNDQMKLFDHLNPAYIQNVLTVGGRYVCGNPDSIMPVWADTNGGPLNYIQIQDLINFIRAPSTQEFVIRNPSLNEPVIGPDGKVETFHGWLDPNFKPAPSSSPVPACWSGGNTASGSAAPSGALPSGATVLKLTALNVAFDVKELSAPANAAFGIDFTNQDLGIPHNVQIRAADGSVIQDNPVLNTTGETTYVINPLAPGTYTFICKIHPIPAMTGTLTVK